MKIFKNDIGNTGEIIAGAALSLIFDGEVQRETMRGEGKGALDLQLKYSPLFGHKTHRQIAVQVKTGKSFVRWHQGRSNLVLQNIDAAHIEKWKQSNQPVLLIWVNPEKNVDLYWKFIGSNTSPAFLHLTNSHKLNPSSLFEIDRLVTISYKKIVGVPKLNVKKFSTMLDAREWARKEYNKIKGTFESVLGNITLSNYAWRHLTRQGRSPSHIKDSMTVLPYVKEILKFIPHQLQTNSESLNSFDNFTVVKRKVLAIYRNIKFNDILIGVVYVRLHETIIYPTNWRESYLFGRGIQQSLILESIYRKPS